MNSGELKHGGGSGGVKNVDHNDVRYVEGKFERISPHIQLVGTPDEKSNFSIVSLIASTDEGRATVQGGNWVNMISGALGTDSQPSLDNTGISIYAHEDPAMCIQIQLGHFTNAMSKSVTLDQKGITIDAGLAGTITLKCGPDEGGSTIELTPTGITISGTLVKIN